MKRILALAILSSSLLLADSSTSNITVTVKSVDKLVVTNGQTIILDGTAGSNDMGPASDDSAKLHYTHNQPGNKKITAETTTSPQANNNDLILSVSVEDGSGTKTIYDDSGSTGAHVVYAGISAGALGNKTVTYSAAATASGTVISSDSDFDFIITFTTLNE